MSPFRFMLVGCGARGKVWTEVADRVEDVDIASFVDVNESNAGALAVPRRRQAFTKLDEAAEQTRPDAVLVATPPRDHPAVIEFALRRGLPILAEKPLAEEMSLAVSLVERAEEAGVPLSLSVQFRYLPVSLKIRQILADGRYGKPAFGQFTYLRNRDPYAPHLNWGTRYPVRVHHPMLVDQTIHHFDLIRYCYRAEPVWIQANTWNPAWSLYGHDSNVASFMELEGGVRVQYLGTWTGGWNRLCFEWRTDFEHGIVTQRQMDSDLCTAATGDPDLTPVPLETFAGAHEDSLRLLRLFVDSVRARQPVPCDGRDHLQTLAMVFAAMESNETGRRVDMEVFRRRHGIPEPPRPVS